MRAPRFTKTILVASCAIAWSCSAILGIEDTTDETDGGIGPRGDGSGGESGGDADGALPDDDATTDGGDPGSDATSDVVVPPACDLTKPFATPTMVANVSSPEYETGARLSSDEKTIWFSRRATATTSGGEIHVATRPDTQSAFTGITKVTELNGGSADGYLTTKSGDLLGYFISFRTGGGDIYRTSRADAGSTWGSLAVVTGVSTGSLEDDVFVVADGRALYFDSNRAGGSLGVYRAGVDVNGNVSPVAPVGGVNTSADETEPVVTLDELTMYFARLSTNRRIMVAKRAATNASWGTATAVTELNLSTNDSPNWISPDGCRILISSNKSGGAGQRDIYFAEKPK